MMRWIEVTRTNCGRYDGPMWIDAGKLLAMQRVSDERGTCTILFTTVAESHSEDGQTPGGFAGFDVQEPPEAIVAMLEGAPGPDQSSPPLPRTSTRRATARRSAGADAPNFDTP